MSSAGTERAPVDGQPKRTGLWAGVRFTEDEARSILAQLDHMAHPDAARRARWERIDKAREALLAVGERPTASHFSRRPGSGSSKT